MFVARLLPLARTFVSLPAGATACRLGPFLVLTTAGCALWATAFVLLGMVAGTAWSTIDSLLGRVLLGVGVTAIVVSLARRGR